MPIIDGPYLEIIEFDSGPIKGVRGNPNLPLKDGLAITADMGVTMLSTSQVRPENLRTGADTTPGARHKVARIGARFWNAGNETFRLGGPFETGLGVYFKYPGGAAWQVALGKIWRFELLAGPELDLVRGHDVRCVIAPKESAFGEPAEPIRPQDWQLPMGFVADTISDQYNDGMVFDLTDVVNGDYTFRMILDPTNKWNQKKQIEFPVNLNAMQFLPSGI